MSDSIQRLIEAAEAAEARLAQLDASKNKRPLTGPQPVDWREFNAMQKRLAQAEADRDTLAAALRARIKYEEGLLLGDEDLTRVKRLTNAVRLALQRAKEAK